MDAPRHLKEAQAATTIHSDFRFGLLAAGNVEGLLETGFRLGRIRDGLVQQQGPLASGLQLNLRMGLKMGLKMGP